MVDLDVLRYDGSLDLIYYNIQIQIEDEPNQGRNICLFVM